MTFTETFTLQPLAPFNFDLTAQIFSSGDLQIRSYANGEFRQVLEINGNLVLFKLTSNGTIQQPKIAVELKSNKSLTPKDRKTAANIIHYIFNLDLDLCSFYKDVENDPAMHQITQQLYGLKNPTTSTVFESLVDSIVEQQISIKVAITIEHRLAKKFGDHTGIYGKTYFAFPTSQNIAAASIDEVQQVGLSMRK